MSRYGFIISAVKNRLSGGKAAYAARMRHMDVIRGERLFKELGEYMAMNPTLAKNLINGLGGYTPVMGFGGSSVGCVYDKG